MCASEFSEMLQTVAFFFKNKLLVARTTFSKDPHNIAEDLVKIN